MTSAADLLARLPLFSRCSPRELRKIARVAERVTAEPDDVLVTEGQPGDAFFVVAAGDALVTAAGKPLATLQAGSFFGEMALLERVPRTATVTATTRLTAYRIGAKDFDRFLDENPAVTRRLLEELAARLRAAQDAPTYSRKARTR